MYVDVSIIAKNRVYCIFYVSLQAGQVEPRLSEVNEYRTPEHPLRAEKSLIYSNDYTLRFLLR